MGLTINLIEIKMHYYTFFKNIFNQSILISRVKKTRFLNLEHKKKFWIFRIRNLKEKDNLTI